MIVRTFSVGALVLTALGLARAQENDPAAAARTIVENEAKFYQLGQDSGTKAAFLEFLADDGIVFNPGPVNGKQDWQKRPDQGISLKWTPVFAAMSRSADLGYTTGPAEWRKGKDDAKPFGYGQFLSIWRKQKDGNWKVALDAGSEVPGPSKSEEAPELEYSISEVAEPAPSDKTAINRLLRNAEGKFATAARTDSTAAILAAASEALRVHREGVFPAVGRDAAALMLSVTRGALAVEKTGGGMSEAGDLAYSYGKYTLTRPEKTERGHYLQIWRMEKDGSAFKLALDYQSPLPPEPKK